MTRRHTKVKYVERERDIKKSDGELSDLSSPSPGYELFDDGKTTGTQNGVHDQPQFTAKVDAEWMKVNGIVLHWAAPLLFKIFKIMITFFDDEQYYLGRRCVTPSKRTSCWFLISCYGPVQGSWWVDSIGILCEENHPAVWKVSTEQHSDPVEFVWDKKDLEHDDCLKRAGFDSPSVTRNLKEKTVAYKTPSLERKWTNQYMLSIPRFQESI